MKKIASFLTLISLFVTTFFSSISELYADIETYFVVTAYYSPLPWQSYYLKGNYEAEKRLNWQGIAWASGKWVFPWMLAAPKSYKFWTRIELEWVWIWIVEDRWWAIVNAWQRWYSYDRIDIWMWHWEEGLKRALSWGKRTVKWKILSWKSESTIALNNIKHTKTAQKLVLDNSIYNKWIGIYNPKNDIEKLQKILKEKWIYSWDINWIYSKSMITEMVDFQVKNKLIAHKNTYWAGYWGKTTRSFVKKMPNKKEEIIVASNSEKQEDEQENEKFNISDFSKFTLSPNSKWENVKKLQKVFKEMWIYQWEENWKFVDIENSLVSYQLSKWVIPNEKSQYAWYFWPKTREALIQDLKELNEIEKLKIAVKIAEEKARKAKEEAEKKKLLALEKKQEIHNNAVKEIEKNAWKKASEIMKAIWTPAPWQVGHNIRKLQKLLADFGYFDVKDTAIYWKQTQKAVIAFQLDNEIISSEKQSWAWHLWPKTREILEKIIFEKIKKEKIEKSKLISFNN